MMEVVEAADVSVFACAKQMSCCNILLALTVKSDLIELYSVHSVELNSAVLNSSVIITL